MRIIISVTCVFTFAIFLIIKLVIIFVSHLIKMIYKMHLNMITKSVLPQRSKNVYVIVFVSFDEYVYVYIYMYIPINNFI